MANPAKLSDFIYTLDFEHEAGIGCWNFKTFYTRREALDYAEKLAKTNPDISVSIGVRPRFIKRNVLSNR